MEILIDYAPHLYWQKKWQFWFSIETMSQKRAMLHWSKCKCSRAHSNKAHRQVACARAAVKIKNSSMFHCKYCILVPLYLSMHVLHILSEKSNVSTNNALTGHFYKVDWFLMFAIVENDALNFTVRKCGYFISLCSFIDII